jgi:hypothetical protein
MAFAPSEYCNTGKIGGCFYEKEFGNLFEYLNTPPNDWAREHGATHSVCVGDVINSPLRPAIVKKTVVYVMVDENDDGPVWEKWSIKNHRVYPNAIPVNKS